MNHIDGICFIRNHAQAHVRVELTIPLTKIFSCFSAVCCERGHSIANLVIRILCEFLKDCIWSVGSAHKNINKVFWSVVQKSSRIKVRYVGNS